MVPAAADYPPTERNSVALEVLHVALVLLRRLGRAVEARVPDVENYIF